MGGRNGKVILQRHMHSGMRGIWAIEQLTTGTRTGREHKIIEIIQERADGDLNWGGSDENDKSKPGSNGSHYPFPLQELLALLFYFHLIVTAVCLFLSVYLSICLPTYLPTYLPLFSFHTCWLSSPPGFLNLGAVAC